MKRWFYEHQILLIADRELKRFIAEAVRDREALLLQALMTAYGPERLTEWADAITGERDDGIPRQTWLWAAPRKQSTVQMSHFFEKLEFLRGLAVHEGWPDAVNDAAVRHYSRRCATSAPTSSKRITSDRRALEVACFMRYALCSAADQLLLMLRRWIRTMANRASTETAAKVADAQAKLREFATAVRKLAGDDKLTRQVLREKLRAMADATLAQGKISRAALVRAWLVERPQQARAVLAKLIELLLASDGDHPVTAALEMLRGVYAG